MTTLNFYKAKQLLGLACNDWPESLTLSNIASLCFPEDSKSKEALLAMLIDAARSGGIEFTEICATEKTTPTQVSDASFQGINDIDWNGYFCDPTTNIFYHHYFFDVYPTSFYKNGKPEYWMAINATNKRFFYGAPVISSGNCAAWLKSHKLPMNDLMKEWVSARTAITCGKTKLHQLIDEAFFSLDKPRAKITADDVLKVLIADHALPANRRQIDVDGTIAKIEDGAIHWRSFDKTTDKPMAFKTLVNLIGKLRV